MSDSLFRTPPVTPFVECPNCKRLIEYGAKLCPTCREEINPDYALASAAVVMHNTQACSLASIIKTAEPAAVIVFLASSFGFFLDAPVLLVANFLTPVGSLLAILFWFRRYGRFKIGDEEFLIAKGRMWTSLKLWTVLLVVQLLTFIYVVRTPF